MISCRARRDPEGMPLKWHECHPVFFAFVLAALTRISHAASAVPEINALETEWINMGLMGPGDVSRHRVEVDRRACEVRFAVSVNGAEKEAKPSAYPLAAAACEDFFVDLEKRRPDRWKNDYSVPMLDGWVWELRILYKDAPEKRFKGNEMPPPGGKELERRIRALAPFASEPRIF
ncbi:hypothetical protein AGMMS50256_34110 [Betaproteobacteria bacterium]|nr:hypothetical protein AGMMS50256_34110 [Betaproteobacteria bacterium]